MLNYVIREESKQELNPKVQKREEKKILTNLNTKYVNLDSNFFEPDPETVDMKNKI
jgi:hypothetical protein